LEKIIGNLLHVNEVYIVDGVSSLDIKLHVSKFDVRTDTKDSRLTKKLKGTKAHMPDDKYNL